MVGTISFYGTVPEGAEGPERLRSLYTARMPQAGAVTFKRDFERQLELIETQLDPQVRKVLLCDGQRILWNYLDHQERFEDYEKLVDFYHTDEHLSHAAEALFGKKSEAAQRWYAKYRRLLLERDDGVRAVRRSLAYYGRLRRLSAERRQALGRGTEVLPPQPPSDGLRLVSPPRGPHRQRTGRGGLQEPDPNAFVSQRDALVPGGGPADPQLPLLCQVGTMEGVLGNLQTTSPFRMSGT